MKNPSQIHQNGTQNPPSWAQNPLKSVPRGLLEGSWRPLGASLARRPPQEPTSWPRNCKSPLLDPLWASELEAQILPKSLLDTSWKPIRYRARKMMPKVFQNPSKIHPKSIQNRSKIDYFFDHALKHQFDFVSVLD